MARSRSDGSCGPAPTRTVTRRSSRRRRPRRGRPRRRPSSASSPIWPCSTRWSPPSWPRPAPAPSRPRPGPRCAAVAPSRSARRAPAGPARARPARRSGSAVASPSARSPAPTPRSTPKKMIRLALRSALSRPGRPGPGGPGRRLGLRRPEHQGRRGLRSRRWGSSAGCWSSWATRTVRRSLVRQPARGPDASWPGSSTPTTSWSTTGWSSPTRTLPGAPRWLPHRAGRRPGGRRRRHRPSRPTTTAAAEADDTTEEAGHDGSPRRADPAGGVGEVATP